MLIDWFTVVAQLINFLILVFLLRRFLYRPIIKTIRARQEEIESHWQEVREQQKVAEAEAASYKEKQEELEQRQQQLLAQAQKEAEQEYHNLVKQARQQVKQKKADWEEAIAQEQKQLFEELKQKLTKQVYEITRRAFQELADFSLEQQAISAFIHRLEDLDEQERESVAQSLQKSENGLVIRTSFELPPESRQKILDSLHQQQIYLGNHVQFATVPELICGIELQASDYKIAWNLKSYLQSLEKNLTNTPLA